MLFSMDLSVLYDPERFPKHVMEALAQAPLDYLEQLEFIRKQRSSLTPWEGAGVLLPLYFSEEKKRDRDRSGQYVVLLNKRSKRVQQAGDLCAPGGGIHPVLDRISQEILQVGLLPWARGLACERAKQRGKSVYKKILFFLGNALRESWEEIHLSPFNVEFLGPLQSYRLQSRRWIIFPVVGRVKRAWQHKLSPEVDKIITIPLRTFSCRRAMLFTHWKCPKNSSPMGFPILGSFPVWWMMRREKRKFSGGQLIWSFGRS